MGRSKTINLTRAKEGNYIIEVLRCEYNYDEQIANRCLVKRRYLDEKQTAERIFKDRLKRINQDILNNVHKFVENCLDEDDNDLFDRDGLDCIYGAVLTLDMQMSDNEPTFESIEKSLKKFKHLHVTRINVNSVRKKNLIEVLEPSKQSKHVFVMIEQAETMSRTVTEMLLGNLKNSIEDPCSPTSLVMIMFCLSIRIQELPFDHINCISHFTNIEKLQCDARNKEILEELIRGRGINMKLDGNLLDLIYDYSVANDASIMSVLYMYNIALFEYYLQMEEAHASMDKATCLAWLDATIDTDKKHQYLCDQMYYFMILLEEPGMFPEDVTDIYNELVKHNKLSESTEFVDAIRNLKKISQGAILKRIDKVIRKFEQTQQTTNGKFTLPKILMKYVEKFSNNIECTEITNQLINELLELADKIDNPISQVTNHCYFNDHEKVEELAITAVRDEETFMKYFCQDQTYFSILLRFILNSPGFIGVNDLATDVEDEYKEIVVKERSRLVRKGPRIKITPKKGVGLASKILSNGINPVGKSLSTEEEYGLIKALFVDTIDSLGHQHFIKLDPRTKTKHLKRTVWPIMTQKKRDF